MLAIIGLAVLVQIVIAKQSGLWADEIFSFAIATGHSLEHPAAAANIARGDFVEAGNAVSAKVFRRYLKHDSPPASPGRVVRAVLLSDTNPPLYYLLLYCWTLIFGTSDIALRLFSVTCSLASVPFLAAIAHRIGGKTAMLVSCILFLFSPMAIYYSTEGRMYSLLWLFVLATTWVSLVLHEGRRAIGMYALWVVLSAAGLLTHYFFIFPWLGIVTSLSVRPGKLSRVNLAACVFVTVALILPWYVNVPKSLAGWRVTKGWLTWRPRGFDLPAALLELPSQFFSGRGWPLWPDHQVSDFVALACFGIIAIVLARRLRFQVFGGQRLVLWLCFIFTCAGPFVFDLVQHTYTVAVPRYAVAALPVAYLLAALGLTCFNQLIRLVLFLVIIVAWMPDVLSIYANKSRNSSPIREIAHLASADTRVSDLILVHSIPSGVLGIARYSSGPAAIASWVGQLGIRHVPESIQHLVTGRTRVTLIKVHEVREPAPEERWLRANAVVLKETRLGSARMIDFRPKVSPTF